MKYYTLSKQHVTQLVICISLFHYQLDVELNSPHLAAQQKQQQQQEQQVASPAQITTVSTPTNPASSKQQIAFTTTSSTKTVPASAVQQQSLVQLIPQADSSGQAPVYFIQSTPTPTMIPLQFPQNAIPMQQLGATAQAGNPQANVISTIPMANSNQPITIAAVAGQNTQADATTARSIIPPGYKVKVEGTSTPSMELITTEPHFSHSGRMTNQSPFRIHSANNYTVGGKDKSEAGPLPRPRMVRSYLDIEGMIGM